MASPSGTRLQKLQTAIRIGSKMKLDEGTSELDPTTRLRAVDLPRFLAHSGL